MRPRRSFVNEGQQVAAARINSAADFPGRERAGANEGTRRARFQTERKRDELVALLAFEAHCDAVRKWIRECGN